MKRRMLFVSPEPPCSPISGGQLRTSSLLEHLAPHFEIQCVTFAEEPLSQEEISVLGAYSTQTTVLPLRRHRRNGPWRVARNLGRALRFVPPLVDRFSEPDARRALTALLTDKQDWVWFEHLWLAPYVRKIRSPATTILDVHNVESDFYRQLRQVSKNRAEHVGYYVFEQAARRVERRYLAAFDHIVAVSEEDRQLLARDCPPEKIVVVPNAVKLPSSPAASSPSLCTLYFAGRLDYIPNLQAVHWFYHRVWPLVRSHLPEVKWHIVGGCPELLDKAVRSDNHIVLAGSVEKTDAYLHTSSLAVVPVHIGGGTRFKILEAWAAGRAVVSTRKGAAGLAARHAENIWIADTPEEFSGAVVRLLSDSTLRARLEQSGWETVREQYSWECLRQRLEAVLHRS